jgi:ketosteroid isomerase-like protein
MNSKPTEIAREGLEAWRKGDFETIEEILDQNVEWRWFEPGQWDCHGRDDVIRTLRERYDQGFARGELEFRDGGEQAVIVVSHPSEIGGPDWPSETATVMQFRNERVVSMQVPKPRPSRLSSRGSPDAPRCGRRGVCHRLLSFLRFLRHESGCGDWSEELPPDSGVREPRRRRPQRSLLEHCFRAAGGFALEQVLRTARPPAPLSRFNRSATGRFGFAGSPKHSPPGQ